MNIQQQQQLIKLLEQVTKLVKSIDDLQERIASLERAHREKKGLFGTSIGARSSG